jgi:DNA-binding GntR family transcriptional regulator
MEETAHTEIERVNNAIYQAIFERRLEPNTRLVESQLAKVLSTSRTNVRQSLLLLAQRKLVKIAPNKGAVVAEPTRSEAIEVFAARRCIEREIIRLVNQRCKPENLEVLHTHLKEEQKARESRDHFELIRATGKFHLILAEIAGNETLLDFLKQLIARSSLILEKFESNGNKTCQENEHLNMVALLADGTEEELLNLMDQHLSNIEQILYFKKKDKPTDLSEVFAPILNYS